MKIMDANYRTYYDKQRFLQSLREIIVACVSWTVTGTTVLLGIILYGQFIVLVALLLPFTYSMMPHIMNLIVMVMDRKKKKVVSTAITEIEDDTPKSESNGNGTPSESIIAITA